MWASNMESYKVFSFIADSLVCTDVEKDIFLRIWLGQDIPIFHGYIAVCDCSSGGLLLLGNYINFQFEGLVQFIRYKWDTVNSIRLVIKILFCFLWVLVLYCFTLWCCGLILCGKDVGFGHICGETDKLCFNMIAQGMLQAQVVSDTYEWKWRTKMKCWDHSLQLVDLFYSFLSLLLDAD